MARAKKRKKIKFRRYTFALADPEKQRYNRLCNYMGVGFRQLVKNALRNYYKQYEKDLPPLQAQVDENQLDLFEPVDLFGQPLRTIKRTAKKS